VLQFYKENPSAGYSAAAANLNIARQTVFRPDARMLEDCKVLKEGDRLVIPDRDAREYA
jgi:hypothetical protein